jgi:hypothetical protein
MKNGGLGFVKRSAPSETEKEDTHGVGLGYVAAQATPVVMAHHRVDKDQPLWSSGQSSGYRSRGPGFDYRRYQIY